MQAGTYTLTVVDNDSNGLPVITSRLTITGEGAETTIIERGASAPAFRLFMVAESGILSLERLTLRGGGGFFFFPPGPGGAIYNSGTLTVTQSTITANRANFCSAGICNVGASGTATITNSMLTRNSGDHDSGAVGNFGGTMVITATTVAHNSADGGGALYNLGTVTVTNSTFTDNTAFLSGDGALVNFGTLVVINTTFARNVARGFRGPSGAAISNGGTLVLTNSTLADNVVSGEQGVTFGSALSSESGATTILQNTLIARNVGQSLPGQPGTIGPDCFAVVTPLGTGVVTSFGNNLIGDTAGCTIIRPPGVRDLTGDPGLGDFTDNGQPGDGHVPLLPTSQAIDAGNDTVCLLRDQLGQRRVNIPRVGTSRCDIGAIEFPGTHDRPHDEKDDHHDQDNRPHDEDDRHDKDRASTAQ